MYYKISNIQMISRDSGKIQKTIYKNLLCGIIKLAIHN